MTEVRGDLDCVLEECLSFASLASGMPPRGVDLGVDATEFRGDFECPTEVLVVGGAEVFMSAACPRPEESAEGAGMA